MNPRAELEGPTVTIMGDRGGMTTGDRGDKTNRMIGRTRHIVEN
jgi:hypothetical protein